MTHNHTFNRRRPESTVETCSCGKFRHTENAGAPIVEQRHAEHTVDVTPNTSFYVSVVDAGRSGFLLGPYETHREALENVERGRRLAEQRDPFAHFYAFGTCSVEGSRRTVFGR